MADDPIHGCIDRWHRHLRGEFDEGLDGLLHPDVVFLSPIVFTPQRGRDLTKMYLMAAGNTFAGDAPDTAPSDEQASSTADRMASFRYVKEILDGHHAMLEFETEVEGKYVNGIDLITCDDDGMITEFKVMIRPLQAVNLMHAQMKAMLEQLSG